MASSMIESIFESDQTVINTYKSITDKKKKEDDDIEKIGKFVAATDKIISRLPDIIKMAEEGFGVTQYKEDDGRIRDGQNNIAEFLKKDIEN
jgi:hypothetical protein